MGIRIEINLADCTQPEVQGLLAMLTAYDKAAIGEQVKTGGFETVGKDAAISPSRLQEAKVAASVPADSLGKTGGVLPVEKESTSGAAEPKRRGRPRKEASEVAPEAHVPTPEASAQTVAAGTDAELLDVNDASSSTDPSLNSAVKPTAEDVRAAFLKLQETKGLQACLDLLKKFSTPEKPIRRVAELPEETWAEAIEGCNG